MNSHNLIGVVFGENCLLRLLSQGGIVEMPRSYERRLSAIAAAYSLAAKEQGASCNVKAGMHVPESWLAVGDTRASQSYSHSQQASGPRAPLLEFEDGGRAQKMASSACPIRAQFRAGGGGWKQRLEFGRERWFLG